MAKLSSDKTYVTVVKGDTLSEIARDFKKYTTPKNATYQQLATWNNIPNPHKIRIGIKIYLSKAAATNPSSKNTNAKHPTEVRLGLTTNSDNNLLATWNWPSNKAKHTEKYIFQWKRYLVDGTILVTEGSNEASKTYYTASMYAEYTIPDFTKKVAFRVQAVPIEYEIKEKDENGNEKVVGHRTEFSKGQWSDWKTFTVTDPLGDPEAPSVEWSGSKNLTLKSTITKFDYSHKHFKKIEVYFEVYRNDTTLCKKSGWIKVTSANINTATYKSYECAVSAGHKYKARYRVRCDGILSEWSAFSNTLSAYPTTPSGLKCAEFTGDADVSTHAVKVSWNKVSSADSYTIQYIKFDDDFTGDYYNWDLNASKITPVTVESEDTSKPTPPCSRMIYELASGKYQFRLCANNGSGNSAYTSNAYITLGNAPGQPTVWSSTSKAAIGDIITLYWIHNSTDNSSQKYCDFKLTYSTDDWKTHTDFPYGHDIKNAPDTDTSSLKLLYPDPSVAENNTYFKVYRMHDKYTQETQLYAELDTRFFSSDVKLKWQVRTSGLTKKYGDFSTERDIEIYTTPELALKVTNEFIKDEDGNIVLPDDDDMSIMETLTSFPFYIKPSVTSDTQKPLGYHLTITALEAYETVDHVGNSMIVNVGDEVYSKQFDVTGATLIEMSAGNIDLENGVEYEIHCVAALDSGLSAEAYSRFKVEWSDEVAIPVPDAEYSLNTDTYALSIRPYCAEMELRNVEVKKTSDGYVETTTVVDDTNLEDVYTVTGEKVSIGVDQNNKDVYYCILFNTDTNGNTITEWYKVNRSSTGQYTKGSRIDINTIKDKYVNDRYTTTGEEVSIGIDSETGEDIYYCMSNEVDDEGNMVVKWYKVNLGEDGKYVKDTSVTVNINSIQDKYTDSASPICIGEIVQVEGEDETYTETRREIFYCQKEIPIRYENVTLDIYRREYDGSFTEIASELDNNVDTYVVDPHPALDYARYRIVAKTINTGAVSYYDTPAYPIGGKAVIIQWDEQWSTFEGWHDDPLAEPAWDGSLLMLPYNIDVTNTTSPEVTLVEYAGRKHPVAYHGTHLGETASWNVTVPKEDTETLYQLRRLKVWMGNVYVREPSGTGYWATITVSDPRKHKDVFVQVSLSITRVEGGI